MGLNISRGNMYGFVTHTWNAIKGACPHGCTYCYMHRWGEQKPVRLVDRELKEFDRDCKKYGDGLFIFVGSSCDMFAIDIPAEWILATLRKCSENPSNKYLFQSKNPGGFYALGKIATWRPTICTTIETNRIYYEMANSPPPDYRAAWMQTMESYPRYVTIEPIMDFDLIPMVELIKRCNPVQVNIGADSGNNHLPEPTADKVRELIAELERFTTVVQKKNLARILGLGERSR